MVVFSFYYYSAFATGNFVIWQSAVQISRGFFNFRFSIGISGRKIDVFYQHWLGI